MSLDETKSGSGANPEAVVGKPSPKNVHLAYLDGLRALAAVYVMLSHAWLHRPLTGWTLRLTSGLRFAHFAVGVFIVLSGFCLMLPIVRGDGTLRGGIAGFLKRRARRILPPYYFAVALSLILIWTLIGQPTGTHWDGSVPVNGTDILTHLLLIHDAFASTSAKINHTHWSVAVEWQIYFLFPLMVLLWRRYGGITLTAVATLLSYIAGVEAVRMQFLEGMHFQYIGLFALGMLGAAVAFSPAESWQKWRRRVPWGWIALGGLAVATLIGAKWRNVHGITIYADPLIGGSAAALLIALSISGPNRLRMALEWKPLVLVGGFSYSLYLIHAPLLQVIWQYGVHPLGLGDNASFWLLAGVGGAIILLLSYLFSLGCERPFMNAPQPAKRPAPVTSEPAETGIGTGSASIP